MKHPFKFLAYYCSLASASLSVMRSPGYCRRNDPALKSLVANTPNPIKIYKLSVKNKYELFKIVTAASSIVLINCMRVILKKKTGF